MRNMQKLISEELLPYLQGPGQYIGLEANARRKDVNAAEVTVAMGFPDAYTIGISHLGSQVLYGVLNDLPFVACDRTYCPLPDAEQEMRRRDIPLFGWESRCALGDFDVVGFSLSYELCATNVLTMLDLAGIPLLAADRTATDPIVVGGDALADSPESMADFFDVFIPGDGEEPLVALVELLRKLKPTGATRAETLLEIARTVPSAYVPQFYNPQYDAEGEFAGLKRLRDDVPETIPRACLKKLTDSPALSAPLVPLFEGVHERVMIEIMRGCPNACRFCQAGHLRRPVRRRSVEDILETARLAIDATGYREISLLSLSTSDYPQLDELIEKLNAAFAERHISISLPSLRADAQLRILPKLTSVVRKSGLTIAAEAGSQRLRDTIGKDITEQNMLAGVRAAWEAGFKSVKVYFMAGLPGERPEDIDAIFELSKRLSDTRREVDGQRGPITASVSWFVPKPHTPMQWDGMKTFEYFWGVRNRLKELARRSVVNFKFHRIERSLLEALLARGDRRVARTVLAAWRNGARMDAWGEYWDWDIWDRAITETHLDLERIVHREQPISKDQPFSHIRCQLGRDYLLKQRQKMLDVLNRDGAG